MNQLTTVSQTVTMTSREMAELTEKRHDSVKRTIDTLAEKYIVGSPQIVEYLDSLGRAAIEYRIGKRDSFVIVAQLSPEFTARLVDRWQELEQKAQQAPRIAPEVQMLDTQLAIAKLLNVPIHMAQVEAVKVVKLTLGTDLSPWLKLAPAQSNLDASDLYLEPNDLAKRLGVSSGIALNKLLAGAGLQTGGAGNWKPTAAANGKTQLHQWVQGNKSGVNLKWNVAFVQDALALTA